jgi:hypothetical protein
VQEQIRQQRTDHTALRRAPVARLDGTIRQLNRSA